MKCKDCRYWTMRHSYYGWGDCEIKLPPHVQIVHLNVDSTTGTRENDGCDLGQEKL